MEDAKSTPDIRERLAKSCYALQQFSPRKAAWFPRTQRRAKGELSISGTRQPDASAEPVQQLPYRFIAHDADVLVVPPRNDTEEAYVIFSGKEAVQGPAGLHSKRIHPKSVFARSHPNLVTGYDGAMKTVVPEDSVAEQRVTHIKSPFLPAFSIYNQRHYCRPPLHRMGICLKKSTTWGSLPI